MRSMVLFIIHPHPFSSPTTLTVSNLPVHGSSRIPQSKELECHVFIKTGTISILAQNYNDNRQCNLILLAFFIIYFFILLGIPFSCGVSGTIFILLISLHEQELSYFFMQHSPPLSNMRHFNLFHVSSLIYSFYFLKALNTSKKSCDELNPSFPRCIMSNCNIII